ncbi:MAG TPA: TonB family protein [Candidatus Acidoferrales bacterium]|nr:TonB family protein [Candidatus Acidoferrales bacterium]
MKNLLHHGLAETLRLLCFHAEAAAALAVAAVLLSPGASAKFPPRAGQGRHAGAARIPRVSEERDGTMPTREGLRLRLVADQGNVSIRTVHPPAGKAQVSYKVRIETEARTPKAKELLRQYVLSVRSTSAGVFLTGEMPKAALRDGRMSNAGADSPRIAVAFEVSVPFNYSLDVQTHAGDIATDDINGSVSLLTYGGNIAAGRIGVTGARTISYPSGSGEKIEARLESKYGGHIGVLDVAGDLRAITAGGHISAGNVSGDAVLRSGGGHIRAGNIVGKTELETGGGNISVQQAGGSVSVTTAGGQIDFGEASGSVRAHTGGGGIRILHVAGPIELQTSDGSICLTRVQGAVRAATGSGTITAWINPKEAPAAPGAHVVRLLGASQLESGQGDIIVFLPRELAANIEATIEAAGDHHIDADPSLPLKISYAASVGQRGANSVRAEGVLNGGGELLRLKTISGNIRVQYFDADPELQQLLVRQQKGRLERQKVLLQQRLTLLRHAIEQGEVPDPPQAQVPPEAQGWQVQPWNAAEAAPAESRLEGWGRKLEVVIWDSIRLDADELSKRVITVVKPAYPDLARRAGIEGTVRLEIQVNKDGTVQVRKALEGSPVLREAAASAVKQWRYHPVVVDGKPVNVISTVAFQFELH